MWFAMRLVTRTEERRICDSRARFRDREWSHSDNERSIRVFLRRQRRTKPKSVTNLNMWSTTVGAGTIDRDFSSQVKNLTPFEAWRGKSPRVAKGLVVKSVVGVGKRPVVKSAAGVGKRRWWTESQTTNSSETLIFFPLCRRSHWRRRHQSMCEP